MKTASAAARGGEVGRKSKKIRRVASKEQQARRRWFVSDDPLRQNDIVGRMYVKHAQGVQSHLLRLGVPSAEVEDVCTEVFLVVLKRLPSYRGTSTFSTWLYGIVRRVAADVRRSARIRYEVSVEQVPERAEEVGVEQQLERAQQDVVVRQAVAMLKPGPRAVLTGYVLDECPMGAVAKRQRIPLQTAYARLYSAQASLRSTLVFG